MATLQGSNDYVVVSVNVVRKLGACVWLCVHRLQCAVDTALIYSAYTVNVTTASGDGSDGH